VVGHQPYPLAAFSPGEIPGTHFQRLSQPRGREVGQLASQLTYFPARDTTYTHTHDMLLHHQ